MQGDIQIALVSLVAVLLRWSITYHPYSGQGKSPMFGDYEAQRHWQEVTFNIPAEKWYANTTDNDLQYWGLDYPPLTAYHSLALAHVADRLNSSYVKLHESRGFASDDHKYFMRLSVLCVDVLVYIPALIYFGSVSRASESAEREKQLVFGLTRKHRDLFVALVYPGLMLIDHGHFQYNSFSLGLFVAAVARMLQDSFISGSVLFVAALNYKQMELYHALPIFFYILGKHSPTKTRGWSASLGKLGGVSLTVVATFLVAWLPFVRNLQTFSSVVFRLFPVARGVFEDKVANVWCTVNVAYKLRNAFSNEGLAKICLAATSLAVLPSCVNLYANPQRERFAISLINCALAFFLFSFQVHEKSILLVAVPVLLHFPSDPFPCFWFLILSHFSMLPLFVKDDLYLAYWATLVFYFFSVSWTWPDLFAGQGSASSGPSRQTARLKPSQRQGKGKPRIGKAKGTFERLKNDMLSYCRPSNSAAVNSNPFAAWRVALFFCSIFGVIVLSGAPGFLKPPTRYPDLFSLLASVYSCAHFVGFFLYFNYKQFLCKKSIVGK